MPRIPVGLPDLSYDVVVERGAVERSAAHLEAIVHGRRLFIVTTEAVWRCQGARLEKGLAGIRFAVLRMPDGEEHKRFSTVESLADQMVAAGADRSGVVLAFGGGV